MTSSSVWTLLTRETPTFTAPMMIFEMEGTRSTAHSDIAAQWITVFVIWTLSRPERAHRETKEWNAHCLSV